MEEVEKDSKTNDADEIEILSAKLITTGSVESKAKQVITRRDSVLKYLLLNPEVGRLCGKK